MTDSHGASDQDSMNVLVQHSQPVNHAPTANAGPDKTVNENDHVTLDGSGTDPDGDSLTYSWTCTGGNLSDYNVAQPTFYAPSVSQDTNYTCTLTVTDSHGLDSDPDSMTVHVLNETNNQEPSVDIKANGSDGPVTIPYGSTVHLSWDSNNADYCVAQGDWSGNKAVNGSEDTQNLYSDKSYTITCYNNAGHTSDTVEIDVQAQQVNNPSLNFWADKYSINKGDSTLLHWTSNNANYCVASDGWQGNKAISGYNYVSPTVDTSFTLTCYGDNNTQVSKTLNIHVNNVVNTVDLSINNSGRNLSAGKLDFTKNVYLTKGDVIEFAIVVKALNKNLTNVTVKDILPPTFTYMNGTTRIDNAVQSDDLIGNGLNIGNLNTGETKTIFFKAYSQQAGTANLTYQNKAEVWADGETMIYDTTALNYGLVYGASTVQTGIKGPFLFPLILSLLSSLLLWSYLTFNKKGQLALATSRTKLRNLSWRLSYLRYKLFK